jgi:hypothetical protein
MQNVNEVLSLVSPTARPKNRRRSAAYAAYDVVVNHAIDAKNETKWDQIGTRIMHLKRALMRP